MLQQGKTNHKSKFYKPIQEIKPCLIKAVSLVFGKSVPVSREMHAYPFLSLLAEVRSSALAYSYMVSICTMGVSVKKIIMISSCHDVHCPGWRLLGTHSWSLSHRPAHCGRPSGRPLQSCRKKKSTLINFCMNENKW